MPKIILKTTFKKTGRRQSSRSRRTLLDIPAMVEKHRRTVAPRWYHTCHCMFIQGDIMHRSLWNFSHVWRCIHVLHVYLIILILEVQHVKTACERMYTFLRSHLPNTHHCDRFVWSLAPTLGTWGDVWALDRWLDGESRCLFLCHHIFWAS